LGIYRYVFSLPPPPRLLRAPILIGLCVAAALFPAAAGAGEPGAHHLEFRLSAPDHQDLVGEGVLMVRARCLDEPCIVVAMAKSKSPVIRTGRGHAKIGAGKAKTLLLPLAKRQRGKLKAALEAGRHPTFTIEATAHDHAGTRIPLSLEVRVQKP
jgi:hypothetical protein